MSRQIRVSTPGKGVERTKNRLFRPESFFSKSKFIRPVKFSNFQTEENFSFSKSIRHPNNKRAAAILLVA